MKRCLFCKKETPEVIKHSFCSNDCAKAWDRNRKNAEWANRPTVQVICKHCGITFETRDKRKGACSPKCTYALRAVKNLELHGYENPGQKPRTEEERAAISKRMSKASKAGTAIREPKRQRTIIAKYGDLAFGNRPGVLEKRFKTNQERYGGDSPFSSPEVREKARGTFQEQYGADYFVQTDVWKQQNKDKYGVEQVFSSDDFKNEITQFESKGEIEVKEFIQSLGLETTKLRQNKFELDIYVPTLSLGVEYNGLYWHCDLQRTDDYHAQKTESFKTQGKRVIHIYSSEWAYRRAQVESRLRAILGKNENKTAIRNCVVKEIPKDEAYEFLDKYHIQGRPRSCRLALGAYHNGELLSVVIIGVHHRDGKTLVLNRFATKPNWNVSGALGKFSKFATNHLKSDLISWCDLRWSDGVGYIKSGWELIRKTPPDYCYTRNFKQTISKQSRKKENVGTPPGITEREHAELDGLRRIYDCGKLTFLFKHKK